MTVGSLYGIGDHSGRSEHGETGDPEWIEPEVKVGGALSQDVFLGSGRWRERIAPTGSHPADKNQRQLCLLGLKNAIDRLGEAMSALSQPSTSPAAGPNTDETVRGTLATYDALEWVHSFDELLRNEHSYKNASNLDPVLGSYVEGAIGARNAFHHGARRVVGIVSVEPVVYLVQGRRWVYADTPGLGVGNEYLQLRWVAQLPGPPIRSTVLNQAFLNHLAARDVRNTFNAIWGFFGFSIVGQSHPTDHFWTSATHPPPLAAAERTPPEPLRP